MLADYWRSPPYTRDRKAHDVKKAADYMICACRCQVSELSAIRTFSIIFKGMIAIISCHIGSNELKYLFNS